MNDGIVFVFVFWFWWIVFTFLVSKSYNKRFFFSLFFLVLLCLQGNFTGVFTLFITCVVLFIFTSYLMLEQSIFKRIQLTIYGLSAAIGYVGIKLILLFDPVVGFLGDKLFIAMTLFLIIFSLIPSKTESAMVVLFIAFANGEWVLRLILYEIGLLYYRTSQFSLDVLAISLSALIISTYLCNKLQRNETKQGDMIIPKEKLHHPYEMLRKKAQ